MNRRLHQALSRGLAMTLVAAGALAPVVAGAIASPALAVDPLPSSDPSNSGGWAYSPAYSDNFDGTSLNTSKWEPMTLTYSPIWRWNAANVGLNGGNLELKSLYNPNDSFNQTVSGWTTVSSDGSWSPLADYVTTSQHRTGASAMVHYNYWSYHVTTQQTKTGLTDGTYTFSAWVHTSGISAQSHKLVAKNCGSADKSTTIPNASGGYVNVTITNIAVTGGSCTVGVESQSDDQGWVRVDDTSFTLNGSSTNLLTNPGFETRTSTPYESGGIMSLDQLKYGYLEAGVKASDTAFPGTCPAFWLEHIDNTWGTEIDIEEIGESTGAPRYIGMTDHTWKTPTSTTLTSHTGGYTSPTDLNTSFHVYGLEWAPGSLKFYVDGVLRRNYTGNTNFDQTGLHIIFSQGIRSPYNSSPTGTGFPAVGKISYLNVWKKGDQVIDEADVVRGAGGSQVPGDRRGENLFQYTGTWTQNTDATANASTTHTSTTTGSTSKIPFYGTGISLLGAKGPALGISTVSIDGGTPVSLDQYAASAAAQQKLFQTTGLTAGHHTLTLTVTGTKNSASTGTTVSLDGVHVLN